MTRCFFLLLLLLPLLPAQAADPKKRKDGPPMVDGLKALKHADANVRYKAAHTLAELGPQAKFAVPALREALEDKHPLVRVKVAEALWKIDKTPTATLLPILLEAMKDKSETVRAAAPPVIALFGAKASTALPALVDALKDKSFEVKLAAITALGDLGPVAKSKADDLLDLVKDKEFFLLEPFVGAALANLGDGAIPTLTKALPNASPERRRLAAYALGSMGPKAAAATPALAKALKHDDAALRLQAARSLGKIGPGAVSAVPDLDKALDDKTPAVRMEAVLATWHITGTATHVPVLVKLLDDDSLSVRDSACQTLAAMKAGARDAVDPLAKLLDDKELRIRAVTTLGAIGPPAAKTLPALRKLMQDKDADTQLWAAFAVWQISGDAKESLKVLNTLLGTEKHYTPAINVLGDMGPAADSLLPTLVERWRFEDVPSDRQALATAIKKIDPKAAAKLGIK